MLNTPDALLKFINPESYSSWDSYMGAVKQSPHYKNIEIDMQGTDKNIKKKVFKGTILYRAVVKVNQKRHQSDWTPDFSKALEAKEEFLKYRVERVTKNRYSDDTPKIKLLTAIEFYFDNIELAPNTYSCKNTTINFWLDFKDHFVHELDQNIEHLKERLKKCNCQSTAKRPCNYLMCAIEFSKKKNKTEIPYDIMNFRQELQDIIYTLPTNDEETIIIEKPDVIKFFEVGDKICNAKVNPVFRRRYKRYLDMFLLDGHTGSRPEEYSAIDVRDVDLRARQIHFRQILLIKVAAIKKNGGKKIFPMLKTKKHRTISIPDCIFSMIEKYYNEALGKPVYKDGDNECRFLFSDDKGRPIRYASMRQLFILVRDEAGLDKRLTLYKFKHTFCTYFTEKYKKVANIEKIRNLITGHSNEESLRHGGRSEDRYRKLISGRTKYLKEFDLLKYCLNSDISKEDFLKFLEKIFNPEQQLIILKSIDEDDYCETINKIEKYLIECFTPEQIVKILKSEFN